MNTPRNLLASGPTRIIEWKIPLWQLLLAVFAVAGFGISQYMRAEKTADLVQAMAEDLRDLKAELKASGTADSATAREIALMQFRLGTVETELRLLRSGPTHPKDIK